MRRRLTSRPAPAASAVAAVVGVFMLVFAIVFFSQAPSPAHPGIMAAFLVVWFAGLIGIIIYHILNATRPDGVPNRFIEIEDYTPVRKTAAERLQELEQLRTQKLVSDTEYVAKRQQILDDI